MTDAVCIPEQFCENCGKMLAADERDTRHEGDYCRACGQAIYEREHYCRELRTIQRYPWDCATCTQREIERLQGRIEHETELLREWAEEEARKGEVTGDKGGSTGTGEGDRR